MVTVKTVEQGDRITAVVSRSVIDHDNFILILRKILADAAVYRARYIAFLVITGNDYADLDHSRMPSITTPKAKKKQDSSPR